MKTIHEEPEEEVKTPGTDATSDGEHETSKFGVTDEPSLQKTLKEITCSGHDTPLDLQAA